MYEIFDSFCLVPTWDTSHPADRQRFRAALDQVILRPDFSPETMGEYIEQHHAEPIWPKDSVKLRIVIDGLVDQARAEMSRVQARR